MSNRTVVGLCRGAAAAGGALALIGSLAFLATWEVGFWWRGGGAFLLVSSVFFAVFVWLVVPAQPRNAVIWTMATSAFFGGLYIAAWTGAASVIDDAARALDDTINHIVPADVPAAAAWMLAVAGASVVIAIYGWLTFGLLLFPDGKLPSPHWRWVAVLAAAGLLASAAGFAWGFRPTSTVKADASRAFQVVFVVLLVAVVLSLAALAIRFGSSSGATRQQFKWVVWGAAIFVPTMVVVALIDGSRFEQSYSFAVLMFAEAVFLGSYGIAVSRYRLFDIDVVIKRTVVYALVVGVLGVVFITGAVWIPTVLPTGNSNLAVAATTLLVFFLFQPVRARIQAGVERRFYRSRYDAQRVADDFADQLRNEIDPSAVAADWAGVVNDTMHPRAIAIWIKRDPEWREPEA